MVLVELLASRHRAPWDELVDVGVARVIRHLFRFQARPRRRGDHLARLGLQVAVDGLVNLPRDHGGERGDRVTAGPRKDTSRGAHAHEDYPNRGELQDHQPAIHQVDPTEISRTSLQSIALCQIMAVNSR